MKLLAYITCPNCGLHINGGPDATWQLLFPVIMCVIAMTASKIITGKWIP